MRIPPFLKPGDVVAVVSPSGNIDREKIFATEKYFVQKGYQVKVGPFAYRQWNRFAGRDEERLQDLQNMLDDPEIKAVICSRGGYGMVRILDRLNFEMFNKNPKWIVGFSDITYLHCHLQTHFDICSLHASMSKDFLFNRKSVELLLKTLEGKKNNYRFPAGNYYRKGQVQGQIKGGNLTVLIHLLGSNSFPAIDGAILFIEDTGEPLYAIDRMMWTLKRAGVLKVLNGLIAGQFSNIPEDEDWGTTTSEIIYQHVKEYSFPFTTSFPAGHDQPNYPLVLNAIYNFKVDENAMELQPLY